MVLVVGGYNSSNSKKLYGIAKAINERSYQIETKDDLKKEWIGSSDIVGITAGASTPEKSIVEIEKLLKEERRDGKHGKFLGTIEWVYAYNRKRGSNKRENIKKR